MLVMVTKNMTGILCLFDNSILLKNKLKPVAQHL